MNTLNRTILKRFLRVNNQSISKVRLNSNLKTVKMNYDVYEPPSNTSAAPLIIMHGLFGSKQNWRGIGRTLAPKLNRKIFAVDARNHGDSPHIAEHGSAHMAADINEFMQTHNIPKACVMGHSMGGRSMMHFALKYPQLVHRAIILDISPISLPRDFSHMEQIFEAMKSISVSPELSMAKGRAEVHRQMTAVLEESSTVDFVLMNLRKDPSGKFYWAPNIEALHNNLRLFSEFTKHSSHLPPFEGPVMFICGTLSNFVQPENWPDIQKIFPNSEIHWLNAGHLVHLDQPHQLQDLVVEFLK